MVRIFKALIPLLLIFSLNIEASKLLDALKMMPADQSQEFSSVDEYMQYRFETLEQNGMPEEAIQLMKDSYELYKIELAIKQIENKLDISKYSLYLNLSMGIPCWVLSTVNIFSGSPGTNTGLLPRGSRALILSTIL